MHKRPTVAETLIRQRVQTLIRVLPSARQGDPDSIHQARVATRRLREVLPLVQSGWRGRKLRRKVRRLTRALGPVRELDVAIQTLDTFTGEAPRAALTHLKQVVRQERRRLFTAMARDVARVDLDKLRRRAAAAARRSTGIDTAARAARRAVRLQSAIDSAGSIYLPDRLHQVRIAVKKLRYALELGRSAGRSRANTYLRTLKTAQDLLGRMHDLEVLITRVRAVQGATEPPTLSLSADLDRLVRRLETDCRQLHGHYMSTRKALLTICLRVAAVPARRRRETRLSPAA